MPSIFNIKIIAICNINANFIFPIYYRGLKMSHLFINREIKPIRCASVPD